MDARRICSEYFRLSRALPLTAFLRYCGRSCRHAPELYRQRSLRPADAAMGDGPHRFTIAPGVRVLVAGGQFGGARELYSRRVYFQGRAFRLEPDAVVVDLGANAGLFGVAAACCAPRGRVVAVEAQSEFLPLIREHADRNGCSDRVRAVHALVGCRSGCFAEPAQRSAGSHWKTDAPVRSLGDILREHGIDRVDFLKIDIEGSEYALFEDDAGCMDRVRRIAMEVHPEHGSPDALARRIRGLGFAVTLRDAQLRRARGITAPGGYLYAQRERAA